MTNIAAELKEVCKELEIIQHAEGRRPGMYRTVGAFEASTRALRIIDRLIAAVEGEPKTAPATTTESLPSDSGLADDLEQLIRVSLTNPAGLRGFIEANYPKEYAKHVAKDCGRSG